LSGMTLNTVRQLAHKTDSFQVDKHNSKYKVKYDTVFGLN